jgi:hypothetical protein
MYIFLYRRLKDLIDSKFFKQFKCPAKLLDFGQVIPPLLFYNCFDYRKILQSLIPCRISPFVKTVSGALH